MSEFLSNHANQGVHTVIQAEDVPGYAERAFRREQQAINLGAVSVEGFIDRVPDMSPADVNLNRSRELTAWMVDTALDQTDVASTDHLWAKDDLRSVAGAMIAKGDSEKIDAVREIVFNNLLGGKPIPEFMGKINPNDEVAKKQRLLEIYENDPHVANVIVEKNVIGFHASNSASLIGVLEHGLLPASVLREKGHFVSSGEHIFQGKKGQQTVSFADWRAPWSLQQYADGGKPRSAETFDDIAAEFDKGYIENLHDFGEEHPYTHNSMTLANDARVTAKMLRDESHSETAQLVRENFPIMYGYSPGTEPIYETIYDRPDDKPDSYVVARLRSDIDGEFRVYGADGVKHDQIPVIAVPKDRVDEVRAITERYNRNVVVIPIEALLETPKFDN